MSKPPFFAQKFIRLLTKTASAQELGPSACWMLAVIACQEDARYYRGPVTFYYSQLMPLCGFTSPKQLRAAIQTAVDLGWLEYTAGRKGKPCYFSVCIPERFGEVDPSGCDESSIFTSDSEVNAETNSTDSLPIRTPKGERKRKRNGHASTPSPNPNPKEGAQSELSGKCATKCAVECPEGLAPSIWQDWLTVRKGKRLPQLTKSIMDRTEREAAKAGLTLVEAITESAERGWGAFVASWVSDQSRTTTQRAGSQSTIARVMPETKVGGYKVSPKQRRAPA